LWFLPQRCGLSGFSEAQSVEAQVRQLRVDFWGLALSGANKINGHENRANQRADQAAMPEKPGVKGAA
jgi:hypothetical protein